MLIEWFARLFGASRPAVPTHHARPTMAQAAAHPQAQGEALGKDAIDAAFFRWITASAAAPASVDTEKMVLDALAQLLQSPTSAANMVPRVPAVIPQLLRSLRDESVSGAGLARQIAQDVVLVAEVIREANSPYYSPSAPIRNIESAVMLLGQNGLRMLLARVAFRPVLTQQSGQMARIAAPAIWSQAEKCALAASVLAPRMQTEPFEAYLAGLMENIGLIVALRLIDQVHGAPTVPRSDDFCRRLYTGARMLSARIARLWEFPPNVIAAIEHCGEEDGPPIAQVLAQADRLSKLRTLVDGGMVETDAAVAGLDGAQLRCFDKLREKEAA